MKVLIIPGYQSSLKGHWQDWLLSQVDGAEMVYQDSWEEPHREDWVKRLVEEITKQDDEVVLVAHSMGSVTVAAMVEDGLTPVNVAGAIVVAPADSESDYLPREITGFSPMPRTTFPFPSLFIGSDNDPYMMKERVAYFASLWGCEFVSIGEKGHINTAAGYGEWPEIVQFIHRFTGN